MTKQIHIPAAVATTIALCYHSMQCAVEYARSIQSDPDCPQVVKNTFYYLSAELNISMERVERRIPKGVRGDFIEQYKENDVLRLENIKRLYMKLSPENQDALEQMVELLEKGETIMVEQI